MIDLEPRVCSLYQMCAGLDCFACALAKHKTPRQVINGIQTGPYKNIYNPENFYVGKNGVGAANNWGDGYQTGESVHEDIMEMIDREADGSDSLEVSMLPPISLPKPLLTVYHNQGLYDAAFDCWWHRLRSGLIPLGKAK